MVSKNYKESDGQTTLKDKVNGKYVLNKGSSYLRKEKSGLFVRVRNIKNATKFNCIKVATQVAKQEGFDILNSGDLSRRKTLGDSNES